MALTVLILERVPDSLRGDLSRWLLEPRASVFVGDVSAIVRDSLWGRACERSRAGSCLLAYVAQNEQGFRLRVHGDPARKVADFDGFTLVSQPKKTSGQHDE